VLYIRSNINRAGRQKQKYSLGFTARDFLSLLWHFWGSDRGKRIAGNGMIQLFSSSACLVLFL